VDKTRGIAIPQASKTIEQEITMDSISRIEMHEKLGTWHFDYNSTEQDYEVFGKVNAPDDWWDAALQDALSKADFFPADYASMIPIIDDEDESLGNLSKMSLIHDLRQINAKPDDLWWERFTINDTFMFWKLGEVLKLKEFEVRMTQQQPQDGVYLHIDHPRNQIYSKPNTDYTDIEDAFSDKNYKKFIIPVHDFKPEHVMIWGNSPVQPLKRGEIFSWKAGVPHFTTNFDTGYRYAVMVHGVYDPEFFKETFNYPETIKYTEFEI